MVQLIWSEHGDIPASDRGLSYGDGLFETIRICKQQPILADLHVVRLLDGANRLSIPLTAKQVWTAIDEALLRYACECDWVLKLILTRGSGGRGYAPPAQVAPRLILSAHAMPALPGPNGVSVALSPYQVQVSAQLAGLKSLNRLDQVMASLLLPAGVYEAILTDQAGRLVEGTRTNLLLDLGTHWVTPPIAHLAVAGVMRAAVCRALEAAGEVVRQRSITLAHLRAPHCKGLYLLNSVMGSVPVRNIGCFGLPREGRLATICPLEACGKTQV